MLGIQYINVAYLRVARKIAPFVVREFACWFLFEDDFPNELKGHDEILLNPIEQGNNYDGHCIGVLPAGQPLREVVLQKVPQPR